MINIDLDERILKNKSQYKISIIRTILNSFIMIVNNSSKSQLNVNKSQIMRYDN